MATDSQVTLDPVRAHRPAVGRIACVDQPLRIGNPDLDQQRHDRVVVQQPQQHVCAARAEHAALSRGVDGSLERRVAGGRTGNRPNHQLVTEPPATHNHVENLARGHAGLLQDRRNVAPPRERQQQMHGLDRGLAQHPRLVLGQDNQVVRLVGKDAHHPDAIIAQHH